MKCAVHPDADAVGYCRNCGKALCAVCVRPVHDVLYCEDCLANVLGHTSPAPAQNFGTPAGGVAPAGAAAARPGNPALAFILGIMFPGLGAVYNGQYNKALIHIVVFATLVLGLSSDMDGGMKAVMGIMLAGFIFTWPSMPCKRRKPTAVAKYPSTRCKPGARNARSVRLS